MNHQKPLCLKCKHYKVTHDPQAPRGCTLYGFNSKDIPSIVVLRETGKPCLGYELKLTKRELQKMEEDRWKNS